MTENTMIEYDFDSVNLDEVVSENDIKKANFEKVPGTFVCTIGKPVLTTKTTNDFTNKKTGVITRGYMSYAVNLELVIDEVIALDEPVLDENKKPIMRNGEIATRKVKLSGVQKSEMTALYSGSIFNDQIRMYHEDEKQGTANRRIKIATALGILKPGVPVTSKSWGTLEGTKVIIDTVWSKWVNNEGETQKNIKLDFFNGYTAYKKTGQPGQPGQLEQPDAEKIDFGDI
jgi:hypothetical protein